MSEQGQYREVFADSFGTGKALCCDLSYCIGIGVYDADEVYLAHIQPYYTQPGDVESFLENMTSEGKAVLAGGGMEPEDERLEQKRRRAASELEETGMGFANHLRDKPSFGGVSVIQTSELRVDADGYQIIREEEEVSESWENI